MPSERNPAAGQDEADDIVDKAPSHPITTTLLIVAAVALLMAIGLSTSELGRYVNPQAKAQLSDYKKTAVQYYKEEFGEAEAPEGEGEAASERPAKPAEEAPAETPAETPAPAPAPAEGEAPPKGEGE